MVRGLTGDGRAQLEDRVLKFLHTWVSIGFLDTSLHPEVLQYVNRPPFSHRDDVIQIQAALAEPTPLPATEHQSETTTPSVSSVGLTASSNQQRIERTIGEMESADLPGLARALFEMETDNWKDLTMFRAVKSLTAWRDDPDAWDSKPFSPLAGKIHDWVNEECLDANPEVRQKAFCALYLLACECERMRNFASSQAIARGLSGRFLRRFNHIRDRAASEAGGPEKLSAALQRLFSKPPKDIQVAIPPLDSRLRALLPAFRAIRDDGGTVDWDACKEFHRSLNLELGQPLPASQEPRAPEFCHQFFRERMHAAESSRTRHRHLSEDLSAAEARGRA
ncbi:uncharacterized protein EI90DRAFT_1681545 [Cantharellus anzutake]|uniref:uncharacterized protein n=1 Tax=Cantharellus anzutake TaxID=1750568 RepID=UPI001907CEE9|nr:uncharacterized protein EI90DRAFT_1681545 [Cantharellus anzutake]KAF8327768.1 hypothetical protein EI90DRAFT_1681545 [Cantharellus anzutake]